MKTQLFEHGFVSLVGGDYDDLIVVNSARVLEEKQKTQLDSSDTALILTMMKERHGSVFEHPVFRFHVCAPIFVVREWQRHRVGSYSEISMRWMKGKERFYVPYTEDVRQVQEGAKKIEYKYENAPGFVSTEFIERLLTWHGRCYEHYENALAMGVAPEQARYFLPNTFFTEFVWTVNARALMNFLSLRCAPTAMYEIRKYANVILEMFKDCMPATAEAFVMNGMVTP